MRCKIYNDIPKGDQEVQIQNWIRHILRNLVSASNTAVAIQAQGPLQELTSDSITDILDESSEYEIQYQTKITVPPQSSPLLDCIQDRYNVVSALRQLRHERLEARNVDIYISPRAKANMLATEDFDLTLYAQEFLSSNKKVFLLLGESGVGKSTFNQALEMELWDKFDVKTGRIPLFIYLPMIENPEYNLVEKHLSNIGFSAAQIHELKAHREFILICDGFDESQQQRNIYKSNQMNQPHSWRAQMVIGCRLEYNGIDYRELYKPTNRNKTDELNSFQEAVMTPFNKTQIHDYINQYVQSGKSTWQTEDYLRALREIQNLQDLVTNPFLLKLALEVLPSLIDSNAGFTSARITRIELYDEFVFQWIERSRVRFRDMELDDNDKEALQNIVTTGFKDRSIKYLKDLASSIYQHQNGKPAIQYSEPKDQDTWKESFFGDRGDNNLLKTTIPLIRNGIQYRFIHKSVLEYGLALSIYDPFSEENDNEPLMPALSRRNSLDSVRSFEMDESSTTKNNIQEQPPTNSTLLNRNLVKEPSVVQFLSERVNKSSSFKQQLLAAVEQSKRNKEMRTAASNAITILIRAGVQFIGADLRGIQIPGADLSYGMFDSAQLSSTDLRKANLRNVWLREASLNEARMDGAQFGELPYLSEEDNVQACSYSLDGKSFAAGIANGGISLYEVPDWKKKLTLKGHTNEVSSISFSANGDQIVSGSNDKTVRVWDVSTGNCLHTLQDHSEPIKCVVFSPQGGQIASGSDDSTVRVWDAYTGNCLHILQGHSFWVNIVVYSPQGDRIASGSMDNTARVWDVSTGECLHVLEGHSDWVRRVVYSPQGDQIATGSDDSTVRVWDASTGNCLYSLRDHKDWVMGVVYSPQGDRIATASRDKTVRVWDVSNGNCLHTLHGHSLGVNSVVYSPHGDQIASGSMDCTIRVWDVSTGDCLHSLQGHTSGVSCVVYSPEGNQLASGSSDKTVRVWDISAGNLFQASQRQSGWIRESLRWAPRATYSPRGDQIASGRDDNSVRVWDVSNGDCLQILQGHSDKVWSIVYSPEGDQITTGSLDNTARVWDASTGKCIHLLQGHSGEVRNVVYSPKGDRIATGSLDFTLRLWDVSTGNCLHTLEGHSSWVRSLAYSPLGNHIASGSSDSTVRVWDAYTGNCLHILQGHTSGVPCVVYSPQGNQIASGSFDYTVRVWDISTGECLHALQGHKHWVQTVVYSPQGDQITSGSDDKTIRVWDISTGNCLHTLDGHKDVIRDIVYSPKGDQIASGSDDGTVRVWSIDNGSCLLVMSGFHGPVSSVIFTSSWLITCSVDSSVRCWELSVKSDAYKVGLCWSTSHGALMVSGANLIGAKGLIRMNTLLLGQRGALLGITDNEE
ncbi:hypothetical protein BGZ76_001506 [Entomortierella beljakovae]|nr:hypothetical protein BGZ76_001506 [Entomortierella beljakovae]